MATTESVTPTKADSTRRYSTRNGGIRPPKRKASVDSWDALEERGKRVRTEEDERWRRRDSVTHLISSIYGDVEAAVEIQQRMIGRGDALSEEELSTFEDNEELRLDYLRELRLAAMSLRQQDIKKLKGARLP